MSIGSQEVGFPSSLDITITKVYAAAWLGTIPNEGPPKRYIGSYVFMEYTPDEVHDMKSFMRSYRAGQLSSTCPATNATTPIPWKELDLDSESSNDSMMGNFLWCSMSEPWAPGMGHLVRGSNFDNYIISLMKSGYPSERTDYLQVEGTRAIDLQSLLLGARAHIVLTKQPERKDIETKDYYLVDKFYGFTDGVMSSNTGGEFPADTFVSLYNKVSAASPDPVKMTKDEVSRASVNQMSAFDAPTDAQTLIELVSRADFDPVAWTVVDGHAVAKPTE